MNGVYNKFYEFIQMKKVIKGLYTGLDDIKQTKY